MSHLLCQQLEVPEAKLEISSYVIAGADLVIVINRTTDGSCALRVVLEDFVSLDPHQRVPDIRLAPERVR